MGDGQVEGDAGTIAGIVGKCLGISYRWERTIEKNSRSQVDVCPCRGRGPDRGGGGETYKNS